MSQRQLYVAVLRPHQPYLVWARFDGTRIAEREQHPKFDTYFTSSAMLLRLYAEETHPMLHQAGLRETLAEAVAYALEVTRKDQLQAALMARNWAKAVAHGESRLEELTSTQLALPGILPVE